VTDVVTPRGAAPYKGRVVVLVDRWTAGEGEALAAGLNAIAKATLVGTATSGLRGELREVTLPHSGLVLRFPAERSYDLDGKPREALQPAVLVDLAAPSGGPGDPILYQALKLLEKTRP
jgi:carboxyl-terminal processing protease